MEDPSVAILLIRRKERRDSGLGVEDEGVRLELTRDDEVKC